MEMPPLDGRAQKERSRCDRGKGAQRITLANEGNFFRMFVNDKFEILKRRSSSHTDTKKDTRETQRILHKITRRGHSSFDFWLNGLGAVEFMIIHNVYQFK